MWVELYLWPSLKASNHDPQRWLIPRIDFARSMVQPRDIRATLTFCSHAKCLTHETLRPTHNFYVYAKEMSRDNENRRLAIENVLWLISPLTVFAVSNRRRTLCFCFVNELFHLVSFRVNILLANVTVLYRLLFSVRLKSLQNSTKTNISPSQPNRKIFVSEWNAFL